MLNVFTHHRFVFQRCCFSAPGSTFTGKRTQARRRSPSPFTPHLKAPPTPAGPSWTSCRRRPSTQSCESTPLRLIGAKTAGVLKTCDLVCLVQHGGDPAEDTGAQQLCGKVNWEGRTQPEENRTGHGDQDHDIIVRRLPFFVGTCG